MRSAVHLLTVSLTSCVAMCGSIPHAGPGNSFAVMLDAGSSGTRAHVYAWPSQADCDDRLSNKLVFEKGDGFSANPGLSAFAGNISGIAAYMEPLMSSALASVPGVAHSSTPIFLQATAGMRLLPVSDQDAILGAVHDVFGDSPFLSAPDNSLVVTGAVEGANEWTSVNYLRGALGSNDTNSTMTPPAGVLGMGGASTQIAFVPLEGTELKAGAFPIEFEGAKSLELYVHSYLGLGATEAQLGLQAYLAAELAMAVEDPCLLRGYATTSPVGPGGTDVELEGSGDEEQCRHAIQSSLVNTDAPCPLTPCSFDGVYQPDLAKGGLVLKKSFYEVSAFFFTAEFFGLEETAPLIEMERAGKTFCALSWEEAQLEYPATPPDFLANYCFTALYFVELLVRTLEASIL